MLWQYLQNNRWKFYNRTKLESEEKKAKTSAPGALTNYTTPFPGCIQLSLNGDLLKTVKSTVSIPSFSKAKYPPARPTLFDFLGHRALEFFMNDESGITKPAYQFRLEDPEIFTGSTGFIKAKFPTKIPLPPAQSASPVAGYPGLSYRRRKPGCADRRGPDPLAFVYNNATLDERISYTDKLLRIEQAYPNNPATTFSRFLREVSTFANGRRYDPFSKPAYQYEIKGPKNCLKPFTAKFPKSEGGINAGIRSCRSTAHAQCRNGKSKCTHAALPVPFGEIQNVQKIYLRVLRSSRDEIKREQRLDYEKFWKLLTEQTPLKKLGYHAPNLQDYQEHSTEIKVDGLPAGIYTIWQITDPGFSH